jgi:hypothetical protein
MRLTILFLVIAISLIVTCTSLPTNSEVQSIEDNIIDDVLDTTIEITTE